VTRSIYGVEGINLTYFCCRKCAYRANQLAQQDVESIQHRLDSLTISVEKANENVLNARDAVIAGTVAVKAEIEKSSSEASNSLQLIRNTFASNVGTILQAVCSLPDLAHKT
jgi:ribosomal 50S subunit-associated protein YjgA (DUF615 family)